VDDDPLVVPAGDLLGGREHVVVVVLDVEQLVERGAGLLVVGLLGRHGRQRPAQRVGDLPGTQEIDDPVVELDHGEVELGQDHVLVVARVTDQGDAVAGAGEVDVRVPQFRVVRAGIVELAVDDGPVTVEVVEVQPRRAEVDEPVGLGVPVEREGRVEREVVVDELAEVGEAGREAAIELVIGRLAAIHEPAGRAEPLGGLESGRLAGGQAREHPAEAAGRGLRARCGGGGAKRARKLAMRSWHECNPPK
jgi:hypothetical protein